MRRRYCERPSSSEQFFTGMFGVDDEVWENIYAIPFLATIESKLRSFQFKINHNIFFTNEKLHKLKMKETLEDGSQVEISPGCTFCKIEVETLEHLFIDCVHVNHLWVKLENILDYSFSRSEKLLGCYDKTHVRSFDILSHLTILLEYFINTSRLKKNSTSLFNFHKKKIITTESTELKIATKNGKIKQHLEKWGDTITKFSI